MKSISVVIPNLNDGVILSNCLQSIRKQNYNQNKIEIIVVDGGSSDNSEEISKKYKVKFLVDKSSNAESAKGMGIEKSKGELILIIDTDNELVGKGWISKMVEILEKEKEVVAVYPYRYKLRKKDKILNRYFALLGVNDPLAYFLGKADRMSYLENKYNLMGRILKEEQDYHKIQFEKDKIPTLGANGFLIKKEILFKSKYKGRKFYHIDSNWDLIQKGYDKYLVAKMEIVHVSGEGFWNYFGKRLRYFDSFYMNDYKNRGYKLFDLKKDLGKLIWFCVASLTLIFPFYQSLKGYLRKKNVAWFLHPIVCFLMFWVYSVGVLRAGIKKVFK